MTKDEALRMALEALEQSHPEAYRHVITAIKEALANHIPDAKKMVAQPEQDCTRSHPHEEMSKECELRTEIARLRNKLANRTWIGLDAEEIRKTDHHMVIGAYHYSFRQGARWAEEALKERNK